MAVDDTSVGFWSGCKGVDAGAADSLEDDCGAGATAAGADSDADTGADACVDVGAAVSCGRAPDMVATGPEAGSASDGGAFPSG